MNGATIKIDYILFISIILYNTTEKSYLEKKGFIAQISVLPRTS